MDRNYTDDIKINEHDLESEWLTQPSLMLYYSEAHAEALHARDTAKVQVDYTFAKIDADIRKNWEKFFDSKPTEGAIKSFILKSPKYKKAEHFLIDCAKEANLLAGIKTSFDHRKRALENIVSLRISGFHAEPKNKNSTGRISHREKTAGLNRKRKRVKSRKSKTTE